MVCLHRFIVELKQYRTREEQKRYKNFHYFKGSKFYLNSKRILNEWTLDSSGLHKVAFLLLILIDVNNASFGGKQTKKLY